MNLDNTSFRTTSRRDRVMATVAALTASAAINGAVLLCFDSASPDQWLAPTPAVLARMARCDLNPSRQAQDDCKQQIVASRLAPDPQSLQLAGR